MTETVESKQQRLDKLKAQKQAILERAKEVQKRIARVESASKAKRKSQDNRTKTLLGVAILGAARRNPQLLAALNNAVLGLTQKDRDFLTGESELWREVNTAAAPTAPAQATHVRPENPHVTQAVQRAVEAERGGNV
ncbi:hypothetical protein [Caballeronia grimmiae]|uniref:hypothetical protein n=1 Tax=Caballeronia grimmiae TaxID=1071679 RepID=UPI0038B96BC7